jgi:hypothetical protein
MEKQKMIEEVTIGGKSVRLEFDDVPIDQIELDEENPRIRYRAKLEEEEGKTCAQVLMSISEVKNLRKDIERNGGLRERVILQRTPKGRFKTVEGNCRGACIMDLHQKDKASPLWKTVPARILPDDVDPKQVATLLADYHVGGKITWNAHEKAGHVHRMINELHMRHEDVALLLRTSKSTVNRLLQAYETLVEKFLKIDGGKYADMGERKWSYFEELFKSKDLRDEMNANPEFATDFCRWVGEGRLPKGEDVRDLSAILKNPDARKKWEKGAPLPEVQKILQAENPELGSDFFKLLERVREACTDTGTIKEILRIRTDKVARDRLLATHEALVDFMQLADVDFEPVKAKHLKSA